MSIWISLAREMRRDQGGPSVIFLRSCRRIELQPSDCHRLEAANPIAIFCCFWRSQWCLEAANPWLFAGNSSQKEMQLQPYFARLGRASITGSSVRQSFCTTNTVVPNSTSVQVRYGSEGI